MALPIVAALTGASVVAVPLVVKVLVGLGVGFVTYQGMNFLLESMFDLAIDQFSGMPANMIQILALCNVDKYLTIISSAFTIRLTISGMNSAGAITKLTSRGLAGA